MKIDYKYIEDKEMQTAIIEIRPTKKEFEFIETNVNKLKERQS